jgi:hypothetical protein
MPPSSQYAGGECILGVHRRFPVTLHMSLAVNEIDRYEAKRDRKNNLVLVECEASGTYKNHGYQSYNKMSTLLALRGGAASSVVFTNRRIN